MNTMLPEIAAKTITVELPEELMGSLGTLDDIAGGARTALILDLVHEADIIQGLAARLIGVTQDDILVLMARPCILSGSLTAEEMQHDIENARRFARTASADGSA